MELACLTPRFGDRNTSPSGRSWNPSRADDQPNTTRTVDWSELATLPEHQQHMVIKTSSPFSGNAENLDSPNKDGGPSPVTDQQSNKNEPVLYTGDSSKNPGTIFTYNGELIHHDGETFWRGKGDGHWTLVPEDEHKQLAKAMQDLDSPQIIDTGSLLGPYVGNPIEEAHKELNDPFKWDSPVGEGIIAGAGQVAGALSTAKLMQKFPHSRLIPILGGGAAAGMVTYGGNMLKKINKH